MKVGVNNIIGVKPTIIAYSMRPGVSQIRLQSIFKGKVTF